MGRRQGIGGDVWNIFILEKKDAENQFFLHLFVWGSESGREWVFRRPGAGAGGGGKGFFPGPVGPGIAMSLGRKIMSGVPSIIFKSHLHGPKRSRKKAFPPASCPCPGPSENPFAAGPEGCRGSRKNKGIKENKGINGIKKKCEKMSLGCARILVDEGA